MPKRHVGSFFHVLTSNHADFDLLITDFAVQVLIFFKCIGDTSCKIINLKDLSSRSCRFFKGQLYYVWSCLIGIKNDWSESKKKQN